MNSLGWCTVDGVRFAVENVFQPYAVNGKPLTYQASLLELLKEAARKLEGAGVCCPRWTAEQLLSHRLGSRPIELYLEPPPFQPDQMAGFRADLAARANGMPLQYLLGSAEFYGREFFVGPGVFIPRPETEVLIEVALDFLKGSPVVVDVGTGSGAIAITLALELPGIQILGVDCSQTALSFAERNRARHEAPLSLLCGDLVTMLPPRSLDGIVANLPYLDSDPIRSWPRELHWEPPLALDGGEKGLEPMKRLLDQAGRALRPDGTMILEIGAGQLESVALLARDRGWWIERVARDLAGLDRVVVLKPKGVRPLLRKGV